MPLLTELIQVILTVPYTYVLRIKNFVLAPTYSCLTTTIGAGELNCRVRNENGCDLSAKAPEQNF
jgi:hypothetical protein